MTAAAHAVPGGAVPGDGAGAALGNGGPSSAPTGAGAEGAPARAGWRDAGTRLAVVATGALVLGAVKIRRPPALRTVCLLRMTTGLPCPLCGSTTAFTRLGQGRVADAFLANPVVLLVALALVLAPFGLFRALRVAPERTVWAVVVVVTGASWLWQLGRFGFL